VRADETLAMIKKGRAKAQGCTRCHGRKGIATAAKKAGMSSTVGFFAKTELEAFKSGSRVHPIMTAVAKALSEEDIRYIAIWLDSLQVKNK